MKKRLFALLTVFVLCFALFSCAKDEADHVVDALEGVYNVYGESEFAKLFDSDTTAIGVSVSVDSLKGIEEYADLIGDIEVPKIEDVKAEFYFDLENAKLAQVGSVQLDGEKVEISAVEDLEKATITSNLLDETYGVETDELFDWMMGSDEALSVLEDVLPVLADFISASEKIRDKYTDVIKDLLREHVDIDKEKDGKYLNLSFDLRAKDLDSILDDLADVIEDDETLEELFDAFGADIGDVVDMMSSALDDVESKEKIEVEMTVLKSNSKLVAMEVELPGGEKIEFEGDDKTDDFTLEITFDEEESVKISHSDGKYEYTSIDSYTYSDGDYYLYEDTVSMTFDNGEVTIEINNFYEDKYGDNIDRDEEKASVTFGYKISGNKLTLKLKGIGYDGIGLMKLDEKIGVTVEIEKNPSLPKTVKKYVELDDIDDFNEKVIAPLTEELRDSVLSELEFGGFGRSDSAAGGAADYAAPDDGYYAEW